jgi:transposase
LDIREILRRLGKGETERRIAHELKVSRKTVRRYRDWATQQELLGSALPPTAELAARLAASLPAVSPPLTVSKAEQFVAQIQALRRLGVECRAIHQRLREEHAFTGSYSSIWRLVRRLEPQVPEAVVRIEVGPGAEAQVDFGYAGRMLDPRSGAVRKSWAFVMTLSHSRHQYVEFVFDQEVATWLACHRRAFEWFGGVPRRIVIDNLKAAILRASLHDPVVQRAYRECAEHYGFLIAPCRPRTPQHKGKVESGVRYLKRNFLAGREFTDVTEANRRVRGWCLEIAGQRLHGTTQERPLERFEAVERSALLALPTAPYALAEWKRVKLHPDCHVVFNSSFYSAPFRLIGQVLWLRAAETSVQVFHAHELVASHTRATRPGQRRTHPDHLPPAKVATLQATPAYCLRRAREIGPHTTALVEQLFGERPVDRLRSVQAILRLTAKYGPRRLEAACGRALAFNETSYHVVQRILARGLDSLAAEAPAVPGPTQPPLFARPWTELFGQVIRCLTLHDSGY